MLELEQLNEDFDHDLLGDIVKLVEISPLIELI